MKVETPRTDTSVANRFAAALAHLPIVAILRGIEPPEVAAVARALYDAGFRLLEIPLNSPDPFTSIALLRQVLPDDAVVGAGTVLTVEQIRQLVACRADLTVMPHTDPTLIGAAKEAGLLCVPGVVTPTEAFAALRAGADALKIFPAELVPPKLLQALRVVLPAGTRLIPVGGITPESMQAYRLAGAAGFGLGSSLYKPGMRSDEVAVHARRFALAWRELSKA